ncbi:hypothetical protein FRC18_005977 [Serendipita sp. 400]|nr:hypothetical protein FRC18_005977 [Serendipita sp. 400]
MTDTASLHRRAGLPCICSPDGIGPSDGVANSYSRQTSPSPLDLHSYSGGTGKLSGGDGVIPVTAETWQNAGVKLEIRSTRGAHSACRPEEISSPPS